MNEGEFERHRAQLFAIAYRMTGSRADADELVSECWLRWSQQDRAAIAEPAAWLRTVIARLSLDHLKSARVRREQYVGPWLPEPIETRFEGASPESSAVLRESVSTAFLLVLESLSPIERAVLVLHDVFDIEHDELAAMLDRTPQACRQALHRAREQLARGRPRFAPSPQEHIAVLAAFSQAIAEGDLESLLRLLAPDARVVTDGGGKAKAARKVVEGAEPVARLLTGLARRGAPGTLTRLLELNGALALLVVRDGATDTVVQIETDGARVCAVHMVRNPDKLAHLR